MSEWCVCGHGSGWHFGDDRKGPNCGFEKCACAEFNDRYPTFDSCEVCGHGFRDWIGNPHDSPSHDQYCSCPGFKWPHPRVNGPQMINPLAVAYHPSKVLIQLLRLEGDGSVIAFSWPLGLWKSSHTWTISEKGSYTARIISPDGVVLWALDKRYPPFHVGDKFTVKVDPRIGDVALDVLVKQVETAKTVEVEVNNPGKRIVET